MSVDRESMIEASVQQLARQALTARYDERTWEIIEEWPGKLERLDRVLVAAGFNFDDGGQQAECGSDLKHRIYTIEFAVFGRTNTQAKNFANTLKFTLEDGEYGTIPLLDVSQIPPVEIDRLYVLKAHAARERIQEPEPWQEHVWSTTITVEDYYKASLAA